MILLEKQGYIESIYSQVIKDLKNPLGKIKRIDCALLPPCPKTLEKKIMRCHYVNEMWSKTGCSSPLDGLSDATRFGWKMENEYVPEWFSGTSVPSAISNTDVQPKPDDSINSGVLEEPDLSDEWTDEESKEEYP